MDGEIQPAPAHWACSGQSSACLSGTAAARGFKAQPQVLIAQLFKVFPLASDTPDQQETVATDGTWAFSNVPPWGHYYVRMIADFGRSPAVAGFAGPLSVPSSGGPVAVTVPPVQAIAAQHGMTGAFVVDWASAHVFDPSSGAELQGTSASLSIAVGGTSTPMPWTTTGGQSLYFVEFGMPPAAQPSYTISATGQPFGSMPATWTLVPSPPSFTPTITSPANGATVPVGSLQVSWPAQAAADYVTVALFQLTDGGTTAVGSSPPGQLPPDTTTQTVDLSGPGQYVVDVYFTSAACPATADGCVLSSTVAAAQFTAQ